jgi:selenocysteine lyase/cysteine desulfurase
MDLKQAKKLFPVTKELTYLDHAAVCPIPGPASDALIDYAECTAKTGAVDHEQFFVRAQRSKKDFARLIKCRSKNIAFIKNTTAGILIASRSFDYRSGDNVIIGSLEFPGNIYPWVYAKDLEVRVAPQKSGIIPVEQVENLIDNRTRAVSLSLVNYSTGGRNNLEAIGKLCEDKNILFIVDAIQAAGSIEFDVKKIKADFLCADGHKWLLGPEGAGLLYVSDRALESCSPVNSGWFSVQDPFNFENIGRRHAQCGRVSGTFRKP